MRGTKALRQLAKRQFISTTFVVVSYCVASGNEQQKRAFFLKTYSVMAISRSDLFVKNLLLNFPWPSCNESQRKRTRTR